MTCMRMASRRGFDARRSRPPDLGGGLAIVAPSQDVPSRRQLSGHAQHIQDRLDGRIHHAGHWRWEGGPRALSWPSRVRASAAIASGRPVPSATRSRGSQSASMGPDSVPFFMHFDCFSKSCFNVFSMCSLMFLFYFPGPPRITTPPSVTERLSVFV